MFGYPKVWHMGHRTVEGMFVTGTTWVQEKYDGSQFSFIRDIETGELICKSHHVILDLENPGKLFEGTVDHLKSVKDKIRTGWLHRGEAFMSNKHNTLKYDRTPAGHLVLFDVDVGHHAYLDPHETMGVADSLGVEAAQLIEEIDRENVTPLMLTTWLKIPSSLGGTKIEGVVMKNYDHMTAFDAPAFCKFVSEAFKEQHSRNLDWKQGKDLNNALGDTFATEARWRKSVQRLRDSGQLEESPQDIGILLKELNGDLLDEYGDELKERVWKPAWRTISRASTRGFAEWYKRELAFPGASPQGDGDSGE